MTARLVFWFASWWTHCHWYTFVPVPGKHWSPKQQSISGCSSFRSLSPTYGPRLRPRWLANVWVHESVRKAKISPLSLLWPLVYHTVFGEPKQQCCTHQLDPNTSRSREAWSRSPLLFPRYSKVLFRDCHRYKLGQVFDHISGLWPKFHCLDFAVLRSENRTFYQHLQGISPRIGENARI